MKLYMFNNGVETCDYHVCNLPWYRNFEFGFVIGDRVQENQNPDLCTHFFEHISKLISGFLQ